MSIPGIDSELVETVRTDVKERGELALLTGPLRGRPYKIYATVWSEADGFFAGFILTSIPARLVRFVLSALFARAIAHGIRHWTCERARIEVALWLAFWIAFYLFYFSVFGW